MRELSGTPLLGRARPWALLVLAGCVLTVLGLGLLFRGQAGPDAFDRAADAPVVASFAAHQGALPWLALPGTVIPAVAVTAVIGLCCLFARRLNAAALAVTAVPAAAGLDDALLKHLFHRTYLGQLAFPSGHTTAVAAVTATLAVLLLIPPQRTATRVTRLALVALACAVTITVAVAVIGLRWHYLTDTVAGAAAGIAVVITLALLLDLGQRAPSGRPGPAVRSVAADARGGQAQRQRGEADPR
jgi:membrane-associated phospholipid phosphatase